MNHVTLSDHMEEILAVAASELKEKSSHTWKEPGNKYYHGIRTAKLVLRLKNDMHLADDAVNPDILTVAAWFHDVCNSENEPHHEEAGAALLPSLIGSFCAPEELSQIQEIIRVHDTRLADIDLPKRLETYSHAVLLLQDADLLDHVGTYDIWISFSDLVQQHKSPSDYVEVFQNGRFDQFAERWRIRFNYPYAREIYNEKIEYEIAFARRMMRELDGEYC